MKTITVQVKEDHLEQLARSKPMAAMAELIWNALDAEASEVRVEFVENEDGELPCPACGHAAALVDGACADCGLHLA